MPGLVLVPTIPRIVEGIRDIRFGRVRLVTLHTAVSEVLGGAVEQVGDQVMPGDRRAKSFAPVLQLFGHSRDSDPYAAGARMRRQVRSIAGNPLIRSAGVYFAFNVDTELNGWIKFGGADIAYAAGGVTFGDFDATLQDSFLVGTQRTHQPAVRLELIDMRSVNVPRDYLRRLYTTDWAALTPLRHSWLPGTITDLRDEAANPVTSYAFATIDGASTVRRVDARSHGEVLRFEWHEDAMLESAVVVLDRLGVDAVFTPAGDLDSQGEYGWEELYGTDYPLTPNDVPVMQNSRCRMRWVPATGAFGVDQFDATTGKYEERGRVHFRSFSGASDYGVLSTLRARPVLREWTEERAVLLVPLAGDNGVCDVYVTLQRGWAGPVFEAYAKGTSDVEFRFTLHDAVATTTTTQAGADTGTFGTQNWVTVQKSSAPVYGCAVGVVQAGLTVGATTDSQPYSESRTCLRLRSGSSGPGYVYAATAPFYPPEDRFVVGPELGLARLTLSRVLPLIAQRGT